MKLFCFPHAGGLASYYSFFKKANFINISESLIYEYPGRGTRFREKSAELFSEYVQDALEFVINNLNGEPFVLFGHSMGAFIAYEISMKLIKEGNCPELVIVSGQKPPCYVFHEYYDVTFDELIKVLKRMGGIPEEIENSPQIIRLLMDAAYKDVRLLKTYTPTLADRKKKIPEGIVLYGDDDIEIKQCDMKLWEKNIENILLYREFKGNHFYLKDHEKEIIEIIDQCCSDQQNRFIGSEQKKEMS